MSLHNHINIHDICGYNRLIGSFIRAIVAVVVAATTSPFSRRRITLAYMYLVTLITDPVTLIIDLDLNILKTCLRARNEVCRSRDSTDRAGTGQTDTHRRTRLKISSSSSSSFYLPEKQYRLQYNKVKYGMTTRQEDRAHSCHLLKPRNTKNYAESVLASGNNCGDDRVNVLVRDASGVRQVEDVTMPHIHTHTHTPTHGRCTETQKHDTECNHRSPRRYRI